MDILEWTFTWFLVSLVGGYVGIVVFFKILRNKNGGLIMTAFENELAKVLVYYSRDGAIEEAKAVKIAKEVSSKLLKYNGIDKNIESKNRRIYMTPQEKIQKKADGYGKLAPVFLEGAKFALENQWISVDEDLPCNNPNNIHFGFTNKVLVMDNNKNTFIAFMKKNKNNKWVWCSDDNFDLSHIITHWMPIPELPKE